MDDGPLTTAELLEAWREATRAADLAARLARQAESAALQAGMDAMASRELARLAGQVAEAATEAAARAREIAERADALARQRGGDDLSHALAVEAAATEVEDAARQAFHHREQEVRERPRPGRPDGT